MALNSGSLYSSWGSPSPRHAGDQSPSSFSAATGSARPQHGENWSHDFHQLLANLAQNPDDSIGWDQLRKLASDFVYCAQTWGRVIIEEAYLPNEQKTIKPSVGLDGAGGAKYEVRGIFFKFSHQVAYSLYHNEENAAKVGGHELRACAAVCGLALSDPDSALFPPLMALVDFRGFRLLAVSHLPGVSKETLVYGSADHGQTVVNKDPEFRLRICKLAERLNLAPHFCRGTEIVTGADCEGHWQRGKPGQFLLLDLARLFPPESPTQNTPSTVSPESALLAHTNSSEEQSYLQWEKDEENTSVGSNSPTHLFRQLRPSLVQQSPEKLSSDAFSRFAESEPDADMHNDRVRRASEMLRGTCVGRAAVFLDHRPADSALYPRTFKIGHFLHERGLNVRLLGLVYCRLPQDSPWKECLRCEMVARTFKSMMRRRWRAISRSHSVTRPSDEDFHLETVRYLNHLLTHVEPVTLSNVSVSFTPAKKNETSTLGASLLGWWTRLAVCLQNKFGPAANGGTVLPLEFESANRLCEVLHVKRYALLERVCQLLCLDLNASVHLPSPEQPISPDMLRPMQPVVKHLNLIGLAEAKVLHLVALNEAPSRACQSLRRARNLLVETRQNQPFVTTAMLEDIGRVAFDLGIRLSPATEVTMNEAALPNLMQAEGAFRDIVGRRQKASNAKQRSKDEDLLMLSLAKNADVELDRSLERDPDIQKALLAKKWANVQLLQVFSDMRHLHCLLLLDDACIVAGDGIAAVLREEKRTVTWKHMFPGFVARTASLWHEKGVIVLGLRGIRRDGRGLVERVILVDQVDGKVMSGDLPIPDSLAKVDLNEPEARFAFVFKRDRLVAEDVEKVRVLGLDVMDGTGLCFAGLSDGSIVVWDLETRSVISRMKDAHEGSITGLVVHSPSKMVLTCSADLAVNVWRFSEESKDLLLVFELRGHTDHPCALAVVELGIMDDAQSEEPPSPLTPSLRLRRSSIGGVKNNSQMRLKRPTRSRSRSTSRENLFDMPLRVASGGVDGSVFVHNASSGRLEARLEGHLDTVRSVCFASASTVISSSEDCTIRLWSVGLCACLRVLTGHTGEVLCVRYDGSLHSLFSSSMDGTVREWRFDRLTIMGVDAYKAQAEGHRKSLRSNNLSERTNPVLLDPMVFTNTDPLRPLMGNSPRRGFFGWLRQCWPG